MFNNRQVRFSENRWILYILNIFQDVRCPVSSLSVNFANLFCGFLALSLKSQRGVFVYNHLNVRVSRKEHYQKKIIITLSLFVLLFGLFLSLLELTGTP